MNIEYSQWSTYLQGHKNGQGFYGHKSSIEDPYLRAGRRQTTLT